MPKRASSPPTVTIPLDRDAPRPLHQQLYERFREGVVTGQFRPGTRLPATRSLAQMLGISRSTVVIAFEQLLAEGYIVSNVGDGTYVAANLPEDIVHPSPADHRPPSSTPAQTLGTYGSIASSLARAGALKQGTSRAFHPCLPSTDGFPSQEWSRLLSRHARRPTFDLRIYGEVTGYGPLRESISEHLALTRGIRCSPDQIIVVAGAQQGIELAGRVLLQPDDQVWVEDPGYPGARAALAGAGGRLVPVPVDGEGLMVERGIERAPAARLAYITPSYQFPLGVTMSLQRRLSLLAWAVQHTSWVLEDDYDNEYHYTGRPLAALQGLDRHGRVIYVGTFSKVLTPTLRVGYLVVPPELLEAFAAVCSITAAHPALIIQAVLADCIRTGCLARHMRRMRELYAERQHALIKAVEDELGGVLRLAPATNGMHLVGWLARAVDDRLASSYADRHDLDVPALSLYTHMAALPPGVLLGYTHLTTHAIRDGVARLARAWATLPS